MGIDFEQVKNISSSEYFNNSDYAKKIFDSKYAHKTANGIETPAETFMRVCSGLSEMESPDKQEKYKSIWFSLMWEGWFRPGGSIISGIGANKKQSLGNCTTVPLSGDTIEDIAKCDYDLMKVAAYRQGVGFDASNLRPKGSKVNNSAEESTGVVPWIDKLVKNGDYVGQKGRRPAFLSSLKITHPDIEDFIDSKMKLNKISNANISVQITNKFMEAVKNGEDWKLSFKIENGELIEKVIDSKKLFKKIADNAYKSAEPGIQFIDLMKNGSMVQCIYNATNNKKYEIISTNACSEKPLPAYSVCNLLSINMNKFSSDKNEYKKQLDEIVPYLVRLSDNVVGYELKHNLSPLKEQREIVSELREIGMGVTNVHGWLFKQNIPYDSQEAIEKIEEFIKYYAYSVFKSSIALGEERGNAPSFDLVSDKKSFIDSIYFKNIIEEFYNGDASLIKNMRNMAHMSIAPTGSLSDIFPQPCLSSGIEPSIGLYYWRKTRAISKGEYSYFFIIQDQLKQQLLRIIPQDTDDYKKINLFCGSMEDNNGKIGLELIEIIKKYIDKNCLKVAHEIDPFKKIKLMGSVYKWIDAAISCTYNLPNNVNPEIVEKLYMSAYDNGVRAISVYRDGSREGIFIFEDPITNKNKNKNFSIEEDLDSIFTRPDSINFTFAPKRPKELPAELYHCNIKGVPWVVIVGLLNTKPYEVFAGELNDLAIPKNCKNGIVKKTKSGTYSLIVKTKNSEIEFKEIANNLMTAEQKALTRMISLSLRHGVHYEFIVNQLKKASGDITDFASVVNRVLRTYISQYVYEKEKKCLECGNKIIYVEGCEKCSVCGLSKCG